MKNLYDILRKTLEENREITKKNNSNSQHFDGCSKDGKKDKDIVKNDDDYENDDDDEEFDSCKGKKCKSFDSVAATQYALNDIKINTIAAIQQWLETGDSEAGLGNDLLALFVGIADENHDGDISEDEADILDVITSFAWDYLAEKGIGEDDLEALLNDFDNDAAGRVFDYLVDNIGDDEDGDEIDNFVFGKEAEESMFDAVYKKKIVVRDGKKVKLNKRISGTVKLTGAQKSALKKARMKAHNASAKIKRLKSMKLRKRLGLK